MAIVATGATLEETFREAARGVFALMVDLEALRPERPVEIAVDAESETLLLVEWIAELLAVKDLEGMLFARFEPVIEPAPRGGFALRATVWGEPPERTRHELGVEVKGISHAALRVGRSAAGWHAQFVVDL
jgi:SHS2 domain-containing protein